MGVEGDSGRVVVSGRITWKALSISTALLAVAFPILAVFYALNGEDTLSDLLAALMVVCMCLFVVLQLLWPASP